MDLSGEMLTAFVLSHLARECEKLLPEPLSLAVFGRALALLTVDDGRARVVGTVAITVEPDGTHAMGYEVARQLEELQDMIALETTARWPLDEGAGGSIDVSLDGNVLRVRFTGDRAKVRLADLILPSDPGARVAG